MLYSFGYAIMFVSLKRLKVLNIAINLPHFIVIVIVIVMSHIRNVATKGYEPTGLTVHPLLTPRKQSRVGSFFSHRYLVPPKLFPRRKSGFCRRY